MDAAEDLMARIAALEARVEDLEQTIGHVAARPAGADRVKPEWLEFALVATGRDAALRMVLSALLLELEARRLDLSEIRRPAELALHGIYEQPGPGSTRKFSDDDVRRIRAVALNIVAEMFDQRPDIPSKI